MNNKSLASIDIGTNTFRLLIAKVNHSSTHNVYTIDKIYSGREVTRLGDGLHDNGLLTNAAIKRSIGVLKEFSAAISENNVYRTSAIATAALRKAVNSEEFLTMAQNEAGLEIEVISGEQEARITAAGMLMDFFPDKPALLLDIGGGSTELIRIESPSVVHRPSPVKKIGLTPPVVLSLNLGVVYLAGKYMKNDPPSRHMLASMGEEISAGVALAGEAFNSLISGKTVFIGTAGTVTALAAISQGLTDFNHDKIHNYELTLSAAKDIFTDISTMPAKERAKLIPFEPGRLDIIVPGTYILLKLMEAFGFSTIKVSNNGLREGILIELYNSVKSQHP